MKKLIEGGNAYADDTGAEEMKEQRDAETDSKHRTATVKVNLDIFNKMCKGDPKFTKFCIRAKMPQMDDESENFMDQNFGMQNKVGCLRDPVFYRCKDVHHHRTGDKFKAYPTYDFTCPIVDSIEGVTHALRTIEYGDRDALYRWVQDTLALRKVEMYEFSKLNFVCTCLSKRKLKWYVENGHVSGWDDPRFPTVQGIMRRGMSVTALKDFMLE
jgi:glutamyl-tRNA synthetase